MTDEVNHTRMALEPKVAPLKTVRLGPLPDNPLVSIVVPSFNQGRFIGDTIRSILEQDYRPIQVLVMDGGSTDETLDVLRSFGDREELWWISEPDRGVADAVNKGFARVGGEIIGIQSSDDLYLPGAISTMVDEFRKRPGHGLLYADMETIDENGNFVFRTQIRPFRLKEFLNKHTWIPQSSSFFRREMLDACGGWDARYFSADTELWMRMVFRTQVEKIEACLSQRRQHEGQRNHQAAVIADAYRRMVRESPDLRASSGELRRAARAGTHIHAIRYNASGSHWKATYHLWNAIIADPELWHHHKRSPILIPGWIPARVALSTIKQWLLRRRSQLSGKPSRATASAEQTR
jgi:glycosyltransferase involved in cell wall biosynthesis